MKRSLSVERLYTLGDYRNIKIISTINEVPEELNDKVSLLFAQLTLECDQAYEDYKTMNEERKGTEDVKAFLESERERIAQELQAGEAGDK